jgi:hypothetical protein
LPIGTDIGKSGTTNLVHLIGKPLALHLDIMNPIRETKTATRLKNRKIAKPFKVTNEGGNPTTLIVNHGLNKLN